MENKKKSKLPKNNKATKSYNSEKIIFENNNISNFSRNFLKDNNEYLNDISEISIFDDNNSMKYKNEKVLLKTNNLEKIGLKLVRKDRYGIEINKSNKKKLHICFLDRFNKPLVEIINVESYKKINQKLYEGFSEQDCLDENNSEKDNNKTSSSIITEKRKEQRKNESIINNKAICASCTIF